MKTKTRTNNNPNHNARTEEWKRFVEYGFKQLTKRELIGAIGIAIILAAAAMIVGEFAAKNVAVSGLLCAVMTGLAVRFMLRLGKADSDRFSYTFCISLNAMLICLVIAFRMAELMHAKPILFALIAISVAVLGAVSGMLMIGRAVKARSYSGSDHRTVGPVIPLICGVVGVGAARLLIGMFADNSGAYMLLACCMLALVFVLALLCAASVLKKAWYRRLEMDHIIQMI